MRLLHIIASMDPVQGGLCQGIRNSIPALQSMGWNNEVICLDDPDAGYQGGDPFPVHALGKGRGPWCYHSNLEGWLTNHLSQFDATVLHGLWLYPGFALHRAAGRARKPYFIFPHGMLDPWFQRDNSRRIKAIRNWLYWKAVEHRVVRNAEALLFTCEEEMRLARQTFRPYRPKREACVGFGIPEPPPRTLQMAEAFHKQCPDLQPDQPYVLFLSRIHPKKGVEMLVEAYGAFRREFSNGGRQCPALVIAGPGLETAYGRRLQQLVQSHCPPSTVFFPGMLSGYAKWGALYGCDAFILPSRQENFGIAVVEALACEKPVLISNKVNIWREIEVDGAGLVEDDTLEGTRRSIEKWVGLAEGDKACMSASARRCFEARFEISKPAKQLVTVIRETRVESSASPGILPQSKIFSA